MHRTDLKRNTFVKNTGYYICTRISRFEALANLHMIIDKANIKYYI